MPKFCRTTVVAACAIASLALSIGLPAVAEASASPAVPDSPHIATLGCGYDGHVNGRPTYNHCGAGSVVIEVSHLFWQHTYACMPRGVHAIPQGDVSWAIIAASFDGNTCSTAYPTAIAGP